MTLRRNSNGVPYLDAPQVFLVARTMFKLPDDAQEALREMGDEFSVGMEDYDDLPEYVKSPDALAQFAGQLCYLSFGTARTQLEENQKYQRNILSQGHGSVLEHAYFSLLFLGIDRATTHELVRHRAGFGFSQVSQRYVGAEHVRFVLPYEAIDDEELAADFEDDIDYDKARYERWTQKLQRKFLRREGESARDHRKRIQSASRHCLPNNVEAPILVTANVRAWRHAFTMRTGPMADVRIRRPMARALELLKERAPNGFQDFTVTNLSDGTIGYTPEFPKV